MGQLSIFGINAWSFLTTKAGDKQYITVHAGTVNCFVEQSTKERPGAVFQKRHLNLKLLPI